MTHPARISGRVYYCPARKTILDYFPRGNLGEPFRISMATASRLRVASVTPERL